MFNSHLISHLHCRLRTEENFKFHWTKSSESQGNRFPLHGVKQIFIIVYSRCPTANQLPEFTARVEMNCVEKIDYRWDLWKLHSTCFIPNEVLIYVFLLKLFIWIHWSSCHIIGWCLCTDYMRESRLNKELCIYNHIYCSLWKHVIFQVT